jgi:hypothetical protein
MSLVKKPRMTEKKLAAVRKMQEHSHGPATPEGRARIRDAHLKHGFYSKSDEMALRALGENPDDFQELLEGLRDDRTAPAALRKCLGEHLARSFWRMRRADRMQEGMALRQAKAEDSTRLGRLHVQMMRLKMTSRNWQLLAESVKNPHYVTTPHDLEIMKHLHEDGVAKDMSEVALALFYQLQEPGKLGPGDVGFEDEEKEAMTRRALAKFKAIFGLDSPPPFATNARGAGLGGPPQGSQQVRCADPAGASMTPEIGDPDPSRQVAGATEAGVAPDFSPAPGNVAADIRPAPRNVAPDFSPAPRIVAPGFSPANADLKVSATVPNADLKAGATFLPAEQVNPYPHITEKQWEAREGARQLLENILSHQVETFDAQHHDLLRQSLAGPSPQERAAEIVPTHPHAALMQRMEDSNFRQAARMASLFIRMKRWERQTDDRENPAVSEDVIDKKAS